jgi:plasmid segregation protein ParM
MSIVAAIDVGYGNVKFTKKRNGALIECGHFPSVAPISRGVDIGGDALSRKDVIKVEVGGIEYAVGNDALLSLKGASGRVLSTDYPERDVYLALVRGALSYMQQSKIEMLVTGLPVNFYRQYKDRLVERLSGIHKFPSGREVEIDKAWVIPQPVGGFLNYAMEAGVYGSLRESNCLVIDIGFYTVDWLVCRGLKVIDERSGSVPSGTSKMLESLSIHLGNELGEPFEDINRLDIAINNRNQLDWYGKPFDFSHLMPKVEPIINSACESIANSVGTLSDVAKVVVVGGGAKHYLQGIRRICHQNDIAEVNESIYANVRGFMIAGEQKVRK